MTESSFIFGQSPVEGSAGDEGAGEGKDPTLAETPGQEAEAVATADAAKGEPSSTAGEEEQLPSLFVKEEPQADPEPVSKSVQRRINAKNEVIEGLRMELSEAKAQLEAPSSAPDLSGLGYEGTAEEQRSAHQGDLRVLDGLIALKDNPKVRAALEEVKAKGYFEMEAIQKAEAKEAAPKQEAAVVVDPGVRSLVVENIRGLLETVGVKAELLETLSSSTADTLVESEEQDFSRKAIEAAFNGVLADKEWSPEFVTGKRYRKPPSTKETVPSPDALDIKTSTQKSTEAAKEDAQPMTPDEGFEVRRKSLISRMGEAQSKGEDFSLL